MVVAELESDQRIHVRFDYDRDLVAAMKTISGRGFVKAPNDKHWTVPLDMTTCRALRKAFGGNLHIGPLLRSWAVEAKRTEERLGAIALATSGILTRLPSVLPGLYQAMHLGPAGRFMTEEEKAEALKGEGSYQTADVRFLADATASLNALHQGLGKTPEVIAAIWEAGLEIGSHLVIAPAPAVDGTWEPELEIWQGECGDKVEIFACTGSKAQREATLARFSRSTAPVKWVIVNPQMIQYRKDEIHSIKDLKALGDIAKELGLDPYDYLTKDSFGRVAPEKTRVRLMQAIFTAQRKHKNGIARKCKPKEDKIACHCERLKDAHWHYEPHYPLLAETVWSNIIIDECHKGNIRNHRSLTSFSITDLSMKKTGKRIAMSGTPMKKLGADIWGLLHWLRPDVFTSYWRFAEMFFEITDNGYGKKVGKLRKEAEGEFFQYLTPYVIRRTKAECLPWLPPKQFIDVPVFLEGKQLKQYQEMEQAGIAALGDGDSVVTTNKLSEFTRCSQFANAYCQVKDGKVVPTRDSAKLDALWQKLEEAGILDNSSDEQTLIFSQYREMVELVATMLKEAGVKTAIISGKENKQGQRRAIKEAFQDGETKVLCIVTTAGGVSLTLDAADSVHFIDQSWAPDDDEQAEDRAHRASRIHNVRVYRYIAIGTIDEYKMETAVDKADSHSYILDVRRRILEARQGQAA